MIRNCKYDTQTIHRQYLTKLLRRFELFTKVDDVILGESIPSNGIFLLTRAVFLGRGVYAGRMFLLQQQDLGL